MSLENTMIENMTSHVVALSLVVPLASRQFSARRIFLPRKRKYIASK